jgi:hypothetical protein
MVKKEKLQVEKIYIENFPVFLTYSKPFRIDAKIIFNKDFLSQKLIFKLLEISYAYGFSCSSPYFGNNKSKYVTFFIGKILFNKKYLNQVEIILKDCLLEIKILKNNLIKQMNFFNLDISMFNDIKFDNLYFEYLTTIRDQNYNGSWKNYYNDMISMNKDDEANIIIKCIEFERVNLKDLGFVGHKLNLIFQVLENTSRNYSNVN